MKKMLPLIAIMSLIALPLVPSKSWSFSSFQLAHPIGWMHQLPVGEMPGWKTESWIDIEFAQSNVWNAPLQLTDLTTGDTFDFFADYEQTHLNIGMGKAITPYLALGIELPFVVQGGGFMDQFIDDFHIFIGSSRFERHKYANNKHNFQISTNGTNYLENSPSPSGIHQLKGKLKWWLWKNTQNESCNCGFSIGAQTKVPVAKASTGGTSGGVDSSLLWHFGLPFLEKSSFWLSSAVTKLGDNDAIKSWPRRLWQQMYEVSISLSWNDTTDIVFQVRSESPILNINNVKYENATNDGELFVKQRVASGYNAMVRWRGSQAIGLRYKQTQDSIFNVFIVEDWNFGRFDSKTDNVYVNNAPDISFVLQWGFGL